ncbi:ABCAA protein, partial [Acromyrmex heyeri]
MLRVREIIRHPKLRRFGTRWRIFMWKAVLMRLHNRITTALEIIIAIVFSLQIRLMFEPFALHLQDLDQYSRNDILTKLPDDVQCWYAPRNAFIDELMLKATKMLHTNIQAADSEINLVHSRYAKNDTSKVLWAIFEIDKLTSGKSKVLEYKIRSSEIGENQMIMMHEEEPAYKDPYVLSGFMALQIAIEKSFVEMWTNPTLPKIADNLIIGRFPFYKINFLILPYIIRPNISIIYYVMVVAFLLLPAATLKKALHDKETGFRSLMRLTNISFAMLYIGWLNYLMIILLPVTIVCTILLFPVFSNANALVIAIFIIMYNILSMLFMFTISALFDHPTKALLTSVLFWLFLTHLTIVLDQFLITESMLWRISSLILPHSGLLYGIIAFTTYTNFVVYYVIMIFTLIDDYSENLRYMWQHTQVKRRNYIGPTSYLWPRWLPELITLRDAHNIIHAKPVYDDNDLIIRGSTNWSAVEHTPSYIKPSIRVRCVRKEFGGIGERITAINDVTIDFYNQEFSVILGHNGAGKSCLLKIITGMYKPTHGHIYLENENSVYPIGYCPQENILVNYLTTIQHLYIFGMLSRESQYAIYKNLLIATLIYLLLFINHMFYFHIKNIKGMTYEDAYRESLKLLKQLDLEYVKDTKMKSCSFGTQRRICLAMALIGNTKILILDEPTYSVDPEHKRQIWDLLLVSGLSRWL